MTWSGGFAAPEIVAYETPRAAAEALATHLTRIDADPVRYARAVAFVVEGRRCWVEGTPPRLITPSGDVALPTPPGPPRAWCPKG